MLLLTPAGTTAFMAKDQAVALQGLLTSFHYDVQLTPPKKKSVVRALASITPQGSSPETWVQVTVKPQTQKSASKKP